MTPLSFLSLSLFGPVMFFRLYFGMAQISQRRRKTQRAALALKCDEENSSLFCHSPRRRRSRRMAGNVSAKDGQAGGRVEYQVSTFLGGSRACERHRRGKRGGGVELPQLYCVTSCVV